MIRNIYNNYYLTPYVQDTETKEGLTINNVTTIKTLQAESQNDRFFSKENAKQLSKIKISTRHTMTKK